MSEYQMTSPPLLSTVLTCIGLTVAAREQRKRQPADAQVHKDRGVGELGGGFIPDLIGDPLTEGVVSSSSSSGVSSAGP